VPNHALVAGVPARRIKWVCECGGVLEPDLICKQCSRKYEETEAGLAER